MASEMNKKVVLKVDLNHDKIKRKAMKIASGLSGVESVSFDMKDKKMTLLGNVDPVKAVSKLRKCCHTEMLSVGPAKEEKKEEPAAKELVSLYQTYPYYYHMPPPLYLYG